MKLPLLAAQRTKKLSSSLILGGCVAAICSAGLVASAQAQQATAPAGPPPARQAIEVRKAVFVLIGNNFKPVGEVLQGKAQYDAGEVQKRATRLAFLSELVGETFPDFSNIGLPDTKAKAEIWSERADFDKRVKEFREHAATLAVVAAKDNAVKDNAVKDRSATDAFKAAAAAVGQDCKGCHEAFKVK